jgi:hypothetical protein
VPLDVCSLTIIIASSQRHLYVYIVVPVRTSLDVHTHLHRNAGLDGCAPRVASTSRSLCTPAVPSCRLCISMSVAVHAIRLLVPHTGLVAGRAHEALWGCLTSATLRRPPGCVSRSVIVRPSTHDRLSAGLAKVVSLEGDACLCSRAERRPARCHPRLWRDGSIVPLRGADSQRSRLTTLLHRRGRGIGSEPGLSGRLATPQSTRRRRAQVSLIGRNQRVCCASYPGGRYAPSPFTVPQPDHTSTASSLFFAYQAGEGGANISACLDQCKEPLAFHTALTGPAGTNESSHLLRVDQARVATVLSPSVPHECVWSVTSSGIFRFLSVSYTTTQPPA